MDGETATRSVQPGGRAPAPGELALIQSFINTHYDLEIEHGAELLGTPAALRRWLRQRDLIEPGDSVTEDDRRRTIALREALRMLASCNGHAAPAADPALTEIDAAAHHAPVELRFAGGEPRFVPATGAGVRGAIGLVLAIVARAMLDGSWSRLKVCPGEDCGWAFYDHSRNQTGRWCSMSICGGRAKARSHYERRHQRTEQR